MAHKIFKSPLVVAAVPAWHGISLSLLPVPFGMGLNPDIDWSRPVARDAGAAPYVPLDPCAKCGESEALLGDLCETCWEEG